jgi:hypothetical protein
VSRCTDFTGVSVGLIDITLGDDDWLTVEVIVLIVTKAASPTHVVVMHVF